MNVRERIEAIKGPGSVLYGSNAFSAVVDLITREAENGFSIGGAPGTAGAHQASGEGTYTCGNLRIIGGTPTASASPPATRSRHVAVGPRVGIQMSMRRRQSTRTSAND